MSKMLGQGITTLNQMVKWLKASGFTIRTMVHTTI